LDGRRPRRAPGRPIPGAGALIRRPLRPAEASPPTLEPPERPRPVNRTGQAGRAPGIASQESQPYSARFPPGRIPDFQAREDP
jgi:hypothetical protein